MILPFQRPRPPVLAEVAQYYELSETARHYSNGGPCVRLLADRIRDRLGVTGVVPVTNATIGLEIALTASLRQKVPHRVVMPSFSFPATSLAASRLGHNPVFVDVDPDTWQIDTVAVETALGWSDSPTIVLGCTTFGTPPDDAHISDLRAVCAESDVPLVIDAAASLGGTTISGKWYGKEADLGVFSLHVTKTAATSEGGLLVSSSLDQTALVERLINFGFDETRSPTDRHATNGKMSEIAAAFALAMLDSLETSIERRRELAERARREFPPELRWQDGVERSTIQFISVALPSNVGRGDVSTILNDRGVGHRTNFAPLHQQPAFVSDVVVGDLAVTDDLSRRILSLPMYSDMTDEEMTWLIESAWCAVHP